MRIGIDLGGSKIEGIVLAANNKVIKKIRIPTPGGDYRATVSAVAHLASELQTGNGQRLSVGVGTPGSLHPQTRLMRNCNSTCLNGRPLQRDIESALGYPVRLANDADCFVLSEATFGAAVNASSVFGVILGTGVGGGIVINQRLLAGGSGITGEWGHNPAPADATRCLPESRDCYCGRQNCVETLLSGPGLSRSHEELSGEQMSALQVAEQAQTGNPAAADTLDRYCHQLAACLAPVINILDPEVIVLGGGLSNLSLLYQRLPELLLPRVFSDVLLTRILPPEHGDASGARGAACLWPVQEYAA